MRRALGFLAVLACLVPVSGCYRHVVSAQGYGADQATIREANVPSEHDKINGYRKYDHKPMP